MKKLFNQFILFFVPYLPMFFVRLVAGRYVAGESREEALDAIAQLNEQGFSAAIDILGEHVKSEKVAESITHQYLNLYKSISKRQLDCNVSIKPSHIGLDVSEICIRSNLQKLYENAETYGNFLRIDMESSKVTDVTIKYYKECLQNYDGVGTVFQAYLYRTEADVKSMLGPKFNCRLCKGIYKEDPAIAIQDRKEINQNFLKILRTIFEGEGYVGIATHDLDLVKAACDMVKEMSIPTERFEFQVLYGVPMSGWRQKLKKLGYKVRVYIPFGPDWYAYSIRRLQENPNIAGYIIGNMLKKT